MSVDVGDIVWYPGTGPAHHASRGHSHIIVKVDATAGDIYCIPVSSEVANWDPTCEIHPHELVPGVTIKSFAAYYHGKRVSMKGLVAQIVDGRCVNNGKVPRPVMDKVLLGLELSDEAEPKFVEAVKSTKPAARRILRAGE